MAERAAIRLTGLYRYPLKSAAAQVCSDVEVEARGLALDRRWMVCDLEGRFVTGRKLPQLSRVQAIPTAEGLRLQLPQRPGLALVTDLWHIPATVQVWKSAVAARFGADQADALLSEYLGCPVRLAYMPESSHRPVDPRYGRATDEVSFADGFPLLMVGQAAVDALNQRLQRSVSALHFRPNLVISGIAAHAEDHWRRLRIGEVEFEVVKPCTRCIFINVDPATAEVDPDGEPLHTLSQYRRGSKGIEFGQNLIARNSGRLQLGDPVELLP